MNKNVNKNIHKKVNKEVKSKSGQKVGSKNMNSFAVVRADDMDKVHVALCDLIRYAHLTFDGKARKLEPAFADDILVHIMKSPLKAHCEAACIVSLNEEASAAIGRLRKIHPPAHIIIVSQRHDIYYELANYINLLPEMETSITPNIYGYATAQKSDQYVAQTEIEL
jgi:hypothetical protein